VKNETKVLVQFEVSKKYLDKNPRIPNFQKKSRQFPPKIPKEFPKNPQRIPNFSKNIQTIPRRFHKN
jgi:hypothetical protein